MVRPKGRGRENNQFREPEAPRGPPFGPSEAQPGTPARAPK